MKTIQRACALMFGLTLLAPSAWGQQPEGAPSQPAPPSQPQGTQAASNDEPAPGGPVADARPLTGAETRTVGFRGSARNYFVPSFQIMEMADSNRYVAYGTNPSFVAATSIVGHLALQRVTRKNQFTLDYSGGGLLYNNYSDLNATIHQLGLTETVKGRRWQFVIGDFGSYLPESAFGFAGFGGFGSIGSLGNITPSFIPNQSIFSGRGNRIANSTVAQLEYRVSARSSVTLNGSYGLLRFDDPAAIDSDQRIFSIGYNRALSRHNTLGILYGVGMLRFRGASFGIDDHYIQLIYGRQITGRMAFEIGGGPEIDVFKSPASGSDQRYYWNLRSSLHYRWPRSDVSLAYTRYTTTGSGVYFGAQTDSVHCIWSWRLTRAWSGSFGPGYGHNRSISQSSTTGGTTSYDSVYTYASLSRDFGRYTSIFINYNLQHQLTDFGSSATGVKKNLTRHIFGLGFNFHGRQFPID